MEWRVCGVCFSPQTVIVYATLLLATVLTGAEGETTTESTSETTTTTSVTTTQPGDNIVSTFNSDNNAADGSPQGESALGDSCVNGTGPCDSITQTESASTTTSTSSTGSAEPSSAGTSASVSESSVTMTTTLSPDGSASSLASSTQEATESSTASETAPADSSFSFDGNFWATASDSTVEPTSTDTPATEDTTAVVTPSSSVSVAGSFTGLSVSVSDATMSNTSVPYTSTFFLVALTGKSETTMTTTGAGLLTTPTGASQLTTPATTSAMDETSSSAVSDSTATSTSIEPLSVSDHGPTPQTTNGESTTPDYVDPFSFRLDPTKYPDVPLITTEPSPTPAPSGTSISRGKPTVEDLWNVLTAVDSKNVTNDMQPIEPPGSPNPLVTEPGPGSDGTVPFLATLSPNTTTPSWENATDHLILPDESNRLDVINPLDNAGSEPTVPPVDAKVVRDTPSPFHPWTAPAAPTTAPARPEADLGDPRKDPNVVTGDPDSPWWPSEDEMAGKGAAVPGDGRQDTLDKFQIVFLVAPCLGALLAVIGLACVIRYATANCRKRRRYLRKLKKQRKQEEKKQKEEEQKRREEKQRRKEKKKSAKAELTEENETGDSHRHKKPKRSNHHHHHHHHHDQHNGHAVDQQGSSDKKSHKK